MSEEFHSDSEFYYPNWEFEEFEQIEHEEQRLETNNNNDFVEDTDSQEQINEFINQQKSANTVKKTPSDINVFERYKKSIGKEEVKIENLPLAELDHLLSKFFIDVRKSNGEEYEPDTLSGFQRSIQRYLGDHHCKFNILKDAEFERSRKVLSSKRKHLVNTAGKGNKPQATTALTDEDEDKLFQTGALGDITNPEVLQRTVWYCLALHFGFRARDETRKLLWGDVELQLDPQDGRERLVWTKERGTKTRKGQENGHQRPFKPKAYASDSERCPVKFYKVFRSHRPIEMNTSDAPFFLAVKHNRRPDSVVWYMKSPLGKNEIGKFLSNAAEEAGIQRPGKKIANHSVRKTHIGRLLDANTPENYVAQLSGHKSLESLQSYKSASENHQRQMSLILSRSAIQPTINASRTSQAAELAYPAYRQITEMRREVVSSSMNGSTNLEASQATSSSAIFAGANISNCNFQVFQGPVKIINGNRRRRVIIESDEED